MEKVILDGTKKIYLSNHLKVEFLKSFAFTGLNEFIEELEQEINSFNIEQFDAN